MWTNAQPLGIEPISTAALSIEALAVDDSPIGKATGFVISREGKNFLATNLHVIAPPENAKAAKHSRPPRSLRIWHHAEDGLGKWYARTEQLFDQSGNPRWLRHKTDGTDVALIPLLNTERTKRYPIEAATNDEPLPLFPSDPVSIIGFPYGEAAAGRYPIWKTGHLASDMDIDYDGRPIFLVDATTRSGMSGSPVAALRSVWLGGDETLRYGRAARFLGVYSGRYKVKGDRDENDLIEIGLVWKPRVLDEILEGNLRGS